MEQTSRAEMPALAAAEPAGDGDGVLRDELAKWRERVPKLAAALRQRAEEAESLRRELDALRRERGELQRAGDGAGSADAPVGAGIRARDELIEELQNKLDDLAERHKTAQGEVHTRGLTIDELRADAAAWKSKWQSVTRALDEQASTCQADQRALQEAVAERDSLRQRNEQLFETTEMANRQITSLTDSLAEMRLKLKAQREQEAAAGHVRDSLQREVDALRGRLGAAECAARELTEELHTVCAAALSGAQALAAGDARLAEADAARQGAEDRAAQAEQRLQERDSALAEQREEVARLCAVVEAAQRTTAEREDERRELSEKLQDLESRNRHLEDQLGERSSLVVTLEQDQAEHARELTKLREQRDALEESLLRAERNVKENGDYVAQLDAKLERQKELIDNLEAELAETKQELAGALKARPQPAAPADQSEEVARLREQARKLEAVVRERTDALNRAKWEREVELRECPAGPPAPETAPDDTAEAPAPAPADADGKLLLVLNQQLTDARRHNAELLSRIRELETTAGPSPGAGHGDDLTRIHGVGHKLAEQLNELGIHRYQQIAELEEAQLAEESHVLHPHRGRILRDGWIDQAVKLISH